MPKNHLPTRAVALAGAAIAALLLTSCAADAGPSGGDNTLTIGLEADPPCLDPRQVAQPYALDVARQVVDTLTDQDPETGEIVPWLAESWNVNDDATEYTFTLRDGATFSNGEAVDADAVVANFDDLTTLTESYGTSFIRNLASYEATAPDTVVFHFSQPDAQFLQATSLVQLGLLAPETLSETSAEDRCTGDLFGSGPFVYGEVVPQERITLEKRDDYAWPSALSSNAGAAHLDSVTFLVIPESGVRNGALLSGEIDVDRLVAEQDEAGIDGAGYELLNAPARGLSNALVPNVESPIWGDVELRRALALAITRDEILPVLGAGSDAATSILTSSTPGYSDVSDLLVSDPAASRAELDRLGWAEGADGIRAKDGERLTLSVLLRPNPARQAVLEVIQQQVAAVGIELVIDVQDDATATESEINGTYDYLFWSASRNEADVLKNFFDPEGKNPTRRADDGSEFNQLLDAISATVDTDARQTSIDRFVELVLTDAYEIPLFEPSSSFGVASYVADLTLDAANRPQLQQVAIDA